MEREPKPRNTKETMKFEPVMVEADYPHFGKIRYMAFIASVGERKFFLNWENTTVRVFSEEYEEFDHVEIEHNDGTKTAFSDSSGEIINLLMDQNYKYHYDPVPDDSTTEWYIEQQKASADYQIRHLLDEN